MPVPLSSVHLPVAFAFQGTMDLLKEQIYIKDALSRIVVEMIKREWPQQWPSMLSELNAIYNMGVRIRHKSFCNCCTMIFCCECCLIRSVIQLLSNCIVI